MLHIWTKNSGCFWLSVSLSSVQQYKCEPAEHLAAMGALLPGWDEGCPMKPALPAAVMPRYMFNAKSSVSLGLAYLESNSLNLALGGRAVLFAGD